MAHETSWTAMTEASPSAPMSALVRQLDALRIVIERLDDESFAARPAGKPSGSIGAHVRHCLDHVAAFLDGVRAGVLCYDRRARGTRDETDRAAALDRISELTGALLDFDPCLLARPLRLDVQLDPDGTSCSVLSTAGREMTFVISHTIHHNATMGVLLSERSGLLPPRFGVAPATPLAAGACAR